MSPSLRRATEADAGACAEIYAPYVLETSISFEREPPDAAELARRIREHGEFAPWLVAHDAQAPARCLGYAYGSRYRARPAYDWTAEVTVYVARDAQRRGVGRALYAALLELMRLQGFHSAVGVIALPNAASVALHEALGFAPAGAVRAAGHKHGAWHDTGFWQCVLGAPGEVARPKRAVADVLASAAGRAILAAAARAD
ncbi:MAG: N-acetyltransferase family protein [Planctomycetota bacterium]|nr:MAG: N-acetyltransferase family protein [Planctomycetota bacterium]